MATWRLSRESFLEASEIAHLLRHLASRGDLDRLIITTLLGTGLRNGELCGLTVAGLDGQGCRLCVELGTKTDRILYIPGALAGELKQAAIGRNSHEPLIPNSRGRPFTPSVLYRRVRRILTDAGFGAVASVQLLRHTYGVMAYRATGGNLLFVQRQMGHAHPMITGVYAEWGNDDPATLAERAGQELALDAGQGLVRNEMAVKAPIAAPRSPPPFRPEWD
ncbi:MAG: site-specific integrase [Phycisphaerales bacterium]|nr:site-specific integrase [Phycisphaerales bacterium]